MLAVARYCKSIPCAKCLVGAGRHQGLLHYARPSTMHAVPMSCMLQERCLHRTQFRVQTVRSYGEERKQDYSVHGVQHCNWRIWFAVGVGSFILLVGGGVSFIMLFVEMAKIQNTSGESVQMQGLEAASEAALLEFVSTRDRTMSKAEIERNHVQLIPKFLSESEVAECLQASSMGQLRAHDESAWARSVDEDGDLMPDCITLCESLIGVAYDMVFSEKHVAYYLHRDGYFQQHHPVLFRKLLEGMSSHLSVWDKSVCDLNVRCIEMHTYASGGGLLSPGHRDHGSILTMTVLLSSSEDFDGGKFITYTEGLPIFHQMATGDALSFHSEQLHNVATVFRGTRCSLVLELWKGPANIRNRFF